MEENKKSPEREQDKKEETLAEIGQKENTAMKEYNVIIDKEQLYDNGTRVHIICTVENAHSLIFANKAIEYGASILTASLKSSSN